MENNEKIQQLNKQIQEAESLIKDTNKQINDCLKTQIMIQETINPKKPMGFTEHYNESQKFLKSFYELIKSQETCIKKWDEEIKTLEKPPVTKVFQ